MLEKTLSLSLSLSSYKIWKFEYRTGGIQTTLLQKTLHGFMVLKSATYGGPGLPAILTKVFDIT